MAFFDVESARKETGGRKKEAFRIAFAGSFISMKLYLDDLYLSPYTYSVHTALREKDLPFETVEVSFEKGRVVTSAFRNLTPTDLIPALEDGGWVLSESLAILEYLDERYPASPIFPAGLRERVQARTLLSWYRCGFHALRKERSTETIFYAGIVRPEGPLSTEAREEVADWMRFLDGIRKPGAEFLFEGRWTIADSETALMLQRLIRNGETVDADWRAYAERLWRRPSVREFVDRERKPFRSYYA